MDKPDSTAELARMKARLRKLQQELDEKNDDITALSEELVLSKDAHRKLKEKNLELIQDARAAQTYRDEIDILNKRVQDTDRLERENQTYKDNLNELEFYKTREEELQENYRSVVEAKIILEGRLAASEKRAEQVVKLEEEMQKYRSQINVLKMEKEDDRERLNQLIEENSQLQKYIEESKEELERNKVSQTITQPSVPLDEQIRVLQQNKSLYLLSECSNSVPSFEMTDVREESEALKDKLTCFTEELQTTIEKLSPFATQCVEFQKRMQEMKQTLNAQKAYFSKMEHKNISLNTENQKLHRFVKTIQEKIGEFQQELQPVENKDNNNDLEKEISNLKKLNHRLERKMKGLKKENNHLKVAVELSQQVNSMHLSQTSNKQSYQISPVSTHLQVPSPQPVDTLKPQQDQGTKHFSSISAPPAAATPFSSPYYVQSQMGEPYNITACGPAMPPTGSQYLPHQSGMASRYPPMSVPQSTAQSSILDPDHNPSHLSQQVNSMNLSQTPSSESYQMPPVSTHLQVSSPQPVDTLKPQQGMSNTYHQPFPHQNLTPNLFPPRLISFPSNDGQSVEFSTGVSFSVDQGTKYSSSISAPPAAATPTLSSPYYVQSQMGEPYNITACGPAMPPTGSQYLPHQSGMASQYPPMSVPQSTAQSSRLDPDHNPSPTVEAVTESAVAENVEYERRKSKRTCCQARKNYKEANLQRRLVRPE